MAQTKKRRHHHHKHKNHAAKSADLNEVADEKLKEAPEDPIANGHIQDGIPSETTIESSKKVVTTEVSNGKLSNGTAHELPDGKLRFGVSTGKIHNGTPHGKVSNGNLSNGFALGAHIEKISSGITNHKVSNGVSRGTPCIGSQGWSSVILTGVPKGHKND